ncbi:MAG: RnfABCDGE type electron transport complex subunit D [Spirochaetia bacterium]|nr:RnfABCDGE type electron transport complex subunit D [Spirochaetia bacterium]
MNAENNFIIESSPHLHHPDSTARIMLDVIIALIPAGIWGIFVFGFRAVAVLAVSIIGAVLGEYLMNKVFKRFTLSDFTAVLTGLLVGYNMPPAVPLFIPFVASLFAIIIVKWTFGGLGNNWMNPALGGRLFVFFSWTGMMTKWSAPCTKAFPDAIGGASPLGFVKTGMMDFTGSVSGPVEYMHQQGYPLNGYMDLFLGNCSGCIGEVSALLLIIGGLYLLYRKVITWEIPVCYLVSFSLFIWIFGGLKFNGNLFTGDVLFNLLSGGLMLGAIFMATDMVTSPLTSKGQIIFGIGCGFLTFLIRVYGSFPEGVSLAIVLMNMVVPLIDKFSHPRVFGVEPAKKGAKK